MGVVPYYNDPYTYQTKLRKSTVVKDKKKGQEPKTTKRNWKLTPDQVPPKRVLEPRKRTWIMIPHVIEHFGAEA